MSAAPVILTDPAGQPVAPPTRITEVTRLPPVWDMNAEVQWLVRDIIPRASVNLLSAESGTGKTWLAYAIAGAVAHGSTFIGSAVDAATPVLYVDGENPLYVVKRNLTGLGITQTDNLRVWGGWNTDAPPGPEDERIVRFARDAKPLLIWDSLVEFAEADEQSSTEMRKFLDHFRKLAHLGATVIILHHTGKSPTSRDYRGSSDIKASVDMAYVIKGNPRLGKLHRLDMEPFKSRIAPGQTFSMLFSENRGFTAVTMPARPAPLDPETILDRIIRENPGSNGTRIKDLAKPLGVGRNTVDEILKGGKYRSEAGSGRSKRYFIREETPRREPTPISRFPDP